MANQTPDENQGISPILKYSISFLIVFLLGIVLFRLSMNNNGEVANSKPVPQEEKAKPIKKLKYITFRSSSFRPKEQRVKLNAKIRIRRYYLKSQNHFLIIKNLNNYNWTPEARSGISYKGIQLKINDTFSYFFGGTMYAGQESYVPLQDFSKKDGTKFNLSLHRLNSCSISCKEGFGFYSR